MNDGIYHTFGPGGGATFAVLGGKRYGVPDQAEAFRVLGRDYVERGKTVPQASIDALALGNWDAYERDRMMRIVIPIALVVVAWIFFRD